ncbi:MAG: hypothetical protein ACJ786_22895, partial [Catenulispora sp.]
MAEVASAFVSLAPSARGFGRQLDRQVSGQVDGVGKKVGLGFGKAMFGAVGAVGAAVGIGSFLSDSIGEAREAQKVGALTNNVIKSTGGVAKVTAGHVGDLSTAISNKVGIDDEAIQSGANLLLTFTQIRNEAGKGNDIFNQTTKAVQDVSVAMGQDTRQSAIQLGKALNDPVKGMTSLRRVGVTFSEDQQNLIKHLVATGDTLGAQRMILHELNKEFGGSAEAYGRTLPGALGKMRTELGNVAEALGKRLAPFVRSAAGWVKNLAIDVQDGTGAYGKMRDVLNDVADVGKRVLDFFSGASDRATQARAALAGLIGGFTAFKVATAAVAALEGAMAALTVVMEANPFVLAATAIAALAAVVLVASKRHGDLKDTVHGAQQLVTRAWSAI